ncbi:MAG TPA: nucleotidyltransferase domain-containing protein [Xanthobacteraceae bacterium]|nr:nucleotidyltransferase domain-containing protein [Xanthobacteraceae bacterium]
MTRDEIIARIRETAPALRAKGVTRLAIFGSRARNDAREDSDLDVLIDVDTSFAGLDLVRVQDMIKEATGLETQAAMRRSIETRFAHRIADDVIQVF